MAQEVSALNHGPSNRLHFGNSSSYSHSPGCSGGSNGAVGMSETSTVTAAPDIKCREESCKRMGRCACFLGSQKIDELEKDLDCLVPEPLEKNKKNAAIVGRVFVNVGEKRQRKPPQRYIEESSKANSKHRQKQDSIVAKHKPPLWREPKKKYTRLLVRIFSSSSTLQAFTFMVLKRSFESSLGHVRNLNQNIVPRHLNPKMNFRRGT